MSEARENVGKSSPGNTGGCGHRSILSRIESVFPSKCVANFDKSAAKRARREEGEHFPRTLYAKVYMYMNMTNSISVSRVRHIMRYDSGGFKFICCIGFVGELEQRRVKKHDLRNETLFLKVKIEI